MFSIDKRIIRYNEVKVKQKEKPTLSGVVEVN
jgi:hypothetical protein